VRMKMHNKILICADAGSRGGKPVPLKSIVDEALNRAEHKVHSLSCSTGHSQTKYDPNRDVSGRILLPRRVRQGRVRAGRSNDPSYILYTSEQRDTQGALRDTEATLSHSTTRWKPSTGASPGIYWAASDVGWVVGHSYIIYAPLFYGFDLCHL